MIKFIKSKIQKKKEIKAQLEASKKKQEQAQHINDNLNRLIDFVTYVDTKVLTTRQQRKNFWRTVGATKQFLPRFIDGVKKNYEVVIAREKFKQAQLEGKANPVKKTPIKTGTAPSKDNLTATRKPL